ncbi:hypothetical protein Bbelb_060560 [Branchiostoma belcheri]|nr:hypothetical protein Bbelb_060560 [Branchiostoma belcheri]
MGQTVGIDPSTLLPHQRVPPTLKWRNIPWASTERPTRVITAALIRTDYRLRLRLRQDKSQDEDIRVLHACLTGNLLVSRFAPVKPFTGKAEARRDDLREDGLSGINTSSASREKREGVFTNSSRR